MIYLLRHGLDDENYIGGWSDVDLVEEGIKQANEAAEYIKNNLKITKIYSSDVKRAIATAKIIQDKLNLELIYTHKLRELDKGIITGMKKEIAKKLYPEYFKDLNIYTKYPNGESMYDLYNRIKNLVNELPEYENSLIVTHRGVINMLYFIFNDRLPDMDKEQFNVDHASIHELDYSKKLIKRIK